MKNVFTLALLRQTMLISIPYILAALGGTLSELGGVVNIALEGLIVMGAFIAVLVSHWTGNAWLGLTAGLAAGALLASLHALLSLRFRADQIISGLAINILAVGVSRFLLKIIFHSSSNSTRVESVPAWLLIALTMILIIVVHAVVYYTPFGLRLRAVGEHPECADTLGVSVNRLRIWGVILSGLLASLGGAWLAFDQHQFTVGMSGGRGYIALTAMIFGKWTPLGATAAALLFGFAEATQIQLQSVGVDIPTQLIQMIPYVLTIVVLAGFIGRATPPAADGRPYPEE